jgi:phage baseplate assembly protein W
VENDWTYTVEGEVAEVREFNLLLQEIQKICFTVRGSNVFHTWYGTNIIETIGKKLSSSGIVQNFIVSDIYESFRRWQDIKRQQEETVGQTVSDGEYPFKLIGVNLEPDSQDPTIVYVTVNMQSRASNKIIPITKSLKLPEPLNILGSSTQQSIFEQTLSGYTLTG